MILDEDGGLLLGWTQTGPIGSCGISCLGLKLTVKNMLFQKGWCIQKCVCAGEDGRERE
jgi:hypothetical protein